MIRLFIFAALAVLSGCSQADARDRVRAQVPGASVSLDKLYSIVFSGSQDFTSDQTIELTPTVGNAATWTAANHANSDSFAIDGSGIDIEGTAGQQITGSTVNCPYIWATLSDLIGAYDDADHLSFVLYMTDDATGNLGSASSGVAGGLLYYPAAGPTADRIGLFPTRYLGTGSPPASNTELASIRNNSQSGANASSAGVKTLAELEMWAGGQVLVRTGTYTSEMAEPGGDDDPAMTTVLWGSAQRETPANSDVQPFDAATDRIALFSANQGSQDYTVTHTFHALDIYRLDASP